MKKIITIFIASAFLMVSCGDSKKDAAPKKEKTKVEKKTNSTGDATKGKELFASKGCTACHHETTKIIGPPVNELASVYADKGADIFKFLKGESEAIVDTDPTNVSIMKNNIDTMVKEISDSDLTNIVAYINSVK